MQYPKNQPEQKQNQQNPLDLCDKSISQKNPMQFRTKPAALIIELFKSIAETTPGDSSKVGYDGFIRASIH